MHHSVIKSECAAGVWCVCSSIDCCDVQYLSTENINAQSLYCQMAMRSDCTLAPKSIKFLPSRADTWPLVPALSNRHTAARTGFVLLNA